MRRGVVTKLKSNKSVPPSFGSSRVSQYGEIQDSRKRGTGKQADLEEEDDDDEEAEYSDKVQDAELAERAKTQGTSLLSRYVTKYARKDDCLCGDRWQG